jgi:hypothetical protein
MIYFLTSKNDEIYGNKHENPLIRDVYIMPMGTNDCIF